MCKHCESSPVYVTQNHEKLCKKCYVRYFEKKVFGTIRKYGMLKEGEKIVVALSGGKDSVTTAYIVSKVLQRRGEPVVALCIDEGIFGYRPTTVEDAERFCKEQGIELHVVRVRDEFGFTLDGVLKKVKVNACTACGTLRRYLLNKYARALGAKKIVTGHNLDDEAQTILMNQLKGNSGLSAKLGPVTGVVPHEKFVPRVKPLYFMSEKEVALYSVVKGFQVKFIECPNAADTFRSEVRDKLNELEEKFPGVKHGFVNTFLATLPLLKKDSRSEGVRECVVCGEPSRKEVCSLCELLEKYSGKKGLVKVR